MGRKTSDGHSAVRGRCLAHSRPVVVVAVVSMQPRMAGLDLAAAMWSTRHERALKGRLDVPMGMTN